MDKRIAGLLGTAAALTAVNSRKRRPRAEFRYDLGGEQFKRGAVDTGLFSTHLFSRLI